MIKWAGYGKLLKQSFFTLLISCFILLGSSFVSAIDLDKTFQNGSYNTIYDNIEGAVYNRGMLGSDRLGTVKRMLAFRSSVGNSVIRRKYFWWNNGYPYFYYYYSGSSSITKTAGKLVKYFLCDSITESKSNYSVLHCTMDDWGDGSFASGFFNSITASDYWGYYQEVNGRGLGVCFSSASYGKSVCFDLSYSSYYEEITMDSNIDYIDFPNSLLGDPPGRSTSGGGSISGGSENVINSAITGNTTYSVCTKEKALNNYKQKGYNENLCYSAYGNLTDIYQSGQSYGAFAIPGIDIEEVRFNTASLRRYGQTGDGLPYADWFQYWRKTFDVYKHSDGTLNNPFVGVPVSVFTLMGNINSYGMSFNNASILEFCDLLLYTADYSVPYSGIAVNSICNQTAIDILAEQYGFYASGGQVVQGSSWEGITNRTSQDGSYKPLFGTGYTGSQADSGLSFYGDGKTFQNNFFNLLSSSFKYPTGSGTGVIPSYIILALCSLVLFRFLRH